MATDVPRIATPLEREPAEPKKPSVQILEEEIAEAVDAFERPATGLFLSGLSAGLDIGFSLFLMAVVRTLVRDEVSESGWVLASAFLYSIGFIFVVLGRSELFTEQTTLAVLPVLRGRASIGALARLWCIVFVANMIGAAAFAWLVVTIGPALGIIDPSAFGDIARPIVAHAPAPMFASAVLAGWLMGLMSWLVTASRDTISQIALVGLIGTVIGIGRLHHVVAGAVEVLAGAFAGEGVSAADCGRFLVWTALGNAVGGSIFVALIKYNSAVRGKEAA